MNAKDLHCPYDKILMREFFNYIVSTGYHMYKNEFELVQISLSLFMHSKLRNLIKIVIFQAETDAQFLGV